jgi:hypothetical protein
MPVSPDKSRFPLSAAIVVGLLIVAALAFGMPGCEGPVW